MAREILEYERPHGGSTLAHTRIGDLRHTNVLESGEGTTRVRQTGETTPKCIMRLFGPIIKYYLLASLAI